MTGLRTPATASPEPTRPPGSPLDRSPTASAGAPALTGVRRAGGHLARPARGPVRAVVPALLLLLTAAALVVAGVDRPAASVAWLALGPLVASLLLSWRWTGVVAGSALLLGSVVLMTRPGSLQTEAAQLLVLAGLGAFAIGNCALRQLREQQLQTVLHVAQVAEAAVLRPVPARTTRFSMGAQYRSSDPVAALGGDVLDVQLTPTGARALVADVRGHGLTAAPLAGAVLASFRTACTRPGLSLLEVARAVDHAVELLAEDEQFATALFIDLADDGWAQVVSCGHPPPLRRDASGQVTALSPREHTTPLGMSPNLRSDTFVLAAGDRLVAYTDGLLEARDDDGQFLALDQHVGALTATTAEAAARELLLAAEAHVGGPLTDDVAVLVLDVDAG